MTITDIRVGHGYDVHRFADNNTDHRPLRLGGVTVPFDRALEAHSDGDLVLHALCDALLGAMGKGDIGEHFPDHDPSLAGADSAGFVSKIVDLATSEHWQISNADFTLVAQAPKLSPHKTAMTANIARLLRLSTDRVNIKATTTERLGFAGREEGLACYSIVLLTRYD